MRGKKNNNKKLLNDSDLNSKLSTLVPEEVPDLNLQEKNALYLISGYLVQSIKKNYTVCDSCVSSLGSNKVVKNDYSKFLRLKAFDQNKFFYVNDNTFNFFLAMDKIFRTYFNKLRNIAGVNMQEFFF